MGTTDVFSDTDVSSVCPVDVSVFILSVSFATVLPMGGCVVVMCKSALDVAETEVVTVMGCADNSEVKSPKPSLGR